MGEALGEGASVAEPMFGMPVGPWFRWFAWHPTKTIDRGWRWMRPVWRRRYQTKPHLDGPTMWWFNSAVADPTTTHPTASAGLAGNEGECE